MAILEVVSAVKQADVMAALSTKPLEPDVFTEIERWKRKGHLHQLNFTGSELLRSLKAGDLEELQPRIVATRLRQFVDEWLNSGFIAGEGEIPDRRSLMKAPHAVKLLREYAEQKRHRLFFSPETPVFIIEVGKVSEDQWPTFPSSFGPIYRAWEEAARLFVGLMISEWGARLCKCHYPPCGRYFLHPKPRRCYRYGTFCRAHQQAWSAVRCTSEKRKRVHSELIDIAARALRKRRVNGPQWRMDKRKKTQLAADVSDSIQDSRDANLRNYRPMVQLKWVTRNQPEIEQRRLELATNLVTPR